MITHGHSDHARAGHGAVLATTETLAIMQARYGDGFAQSAEAVRYWADRQIFIRKYLKKFEEQLIVNAALRVSTWRGLWKSPELARCCGCYRRFGDGSSDKSRTTGQSSSVARPSELCAYPRFAND